jgi:hypothetical protein
LKITIKIVPEMAEALPLFADYVESWRVTCWETVFFILFKSNDGIMKIIFLISNLGDFKP